MRDGASDIVACIEIIGTLRTPRSVNAISAPGRSNENENTTRLVVLSTGTETVWPVGDRVPVLQRTVSAPNDIVIS